METKVCTKCGIEKPLSDYARDNRAKLGFQFRCKACNKLYKEKNKEKISKRMKIYTAENKERIREYKKRHRYNNIVLKEKKKAYHRNRRKTDIEYAMLCNMRKRLWDALKGHSKSASTMQLIGCTVGELMLYLETQFTDGMSWDNYGRWHVDHIKPCAVFDLTDPAQQKECFHYSNLQPLWAKENIAKGAKYAGE